MRGLSSTSGFQRLGLRTPFFGPHAVFARGPAGVPLRQPCRECARNDAEHGGDNHHRKQRRRDRQRGVVDGSEWVERNDHIMTIGEGETQKDEGDEGKEGDSKEANNEILSRPTRRERASSSQAVVLMILERLS